MRRNAEVRLDRLLALLAHCVRNTESGSESKQGCDHAARMLASHSPDEVVQALATGWREHSDFPGALEKFRAIWREVASSRPEFAGRSFEDVIAVGAPEEEFEVGFRHGHRPGAVPPPWAAKRRRPATQEPLPPWQTDARSTRNRINEAAGLADKNYCLREIYNRSIATGSTLVKTTFWTFDGAFSRGTLVAFCSEPVLGGGAAITEGWTSIGGNPYQVKAVFATFSGISGKALLVRLLGSDVADMSDGLWIEFSSPNENPWNDQAFVRTAATLVALAEEKTEAATERPRRISGAFYCGKCKQKIELEGGAMPDTCQTCGLSLRQFKDWPREFEQTEGGFERAWGRRRANPRLTAHRTAR